MKTKKKKGDRARAMRAMYIACHDVRKVMAHFNSSLETVRRNIRWAQNHEGSQ